jgi:hypothetical protein
MRKRKAGASRNAMPTSLPPEEIAGRAVPDPRIRQYLVPTRVVWTSGAGVENPECLLRAKVGQITLSDEVLCTLRNDGETPGVLLDFGQELQGGVQISISSCGENNRAQLRVRFGESVSEAMSEVGGQQNATNDHAVRDQIISVVGLGSHEIGNSGFRFVRIDLIEPGNVTIKAVRAVFIYRDLEYKGSFRCNDARLNRIWQTGAYTIHLNMQDYVWDGIKRDRLVWIGDMHPEVMTIGAVFGKTDVVPASLDLVRDITALPEWMNGISAYSMWWVLIHHNWYLQHGDLAYLKQQKKYLKGLLGQLMGHIGPDNRETLGGMRFLDWPTYSNGAAVHAGLHGLLILTLQAGAELCTALKDSKLQGKCEEAVARLRKYIPEHDHNKQAAALMALAGLGDAAALNREVLAVDGAQRMSTFYGYYMLQARAKAGDYQGCLDCLRTYWGGMLDLGATTFWEDFNLKWTANAGRIDELVPEGKADIHGDFGDYCYKGFRHSLCHGWASGPTAWLSEHVLGVKIVKAGCKVVRIEPHLGDLQWVEGTFPTPRGILKVRHEKQSDGSVKSEVEAPAGIKIAEH